MAELSHRALRELIEIFGDCDEYFTEMISASALIGGGPFEQWYRDPGPCPERLVYQLVGSHPEQLAQAVRLLDAGECAGIDLNMGCAAPAIVRTGAGVRWMASVDRAGALIKLLRPLTARRLSVKLRIGMEDDFEYLVQFCTRLEAEGVQRIALHPRTAREKFKRQARWEYVSRLRAALHIPVAGNGDITDAPELVRRSQEGYDAIMVGRLALRAPWVFAQARQLENPDVPRPKLPPSVDLEELALRFLELLARYQPQEFHQSRAHRFFAYFCDNFTWATYLKNRLRRETGLSAMASCLSAYCRDHPEERNRLLTLSPGLA
ncbi:MAG: tRNA-dihydrouridine synthase family protein [Spirochaetaceae bacterium]|nr:tRNA-dihydrouridine synthase family protein [Spirochaetaceae bacterium]